MRAQLKGSTAAINATAGYKGVLVLNTDTNRLHVLTGVAGNSIELANLQDIPDPVDISGKADKTYVDQQLANKQPIGDYVISAELTEGLDTKLGKSENAVSATKATQDASGNVITTTYATKLELSSGLASKQPTGDYATNDALTQGLATKVDNSTYTTDKATFLTKTDASITYLGKTDKAESAKVADSANSVDGTNVTGTVANATSASQDALGRVINDTYLTKDEGVDTSNLIPKSGDAGAISCYEMADVRNPSSDNLTQSLTLTATSPSVTVFSSSSILGVYEVTVNCTAAAESVNVIKVMAFKNAAWKMVVSISGASWANGGDAPAFGSKANSTLIVAAHFIGGAVYLHQIELNESDVAANTPGSGGND